MEEYYRCYAAVDLDAAVHNISEIRRTVGPDSALIAIVKADAYGHGSVPLAKAIEKYVNGFGVASAEEGLELREAGIRLPVLILGYTSPVQYNDILANNITPSVFYYEDARILSDRAGKMNRMAKIHIPIDTGMSRVGFLPGDAAVSNIIKISELPNIFVEGMFSHLACADMEDDPASERQFSEFDSVNEGLIEKGLRIPIRHICNSAGIQRYKEHYANAVRAGIILYGLMPSEETGFGGLDLKPLLEWKTHVIRVEEIPKGRGVSYGQTFVTDRPVTCVATIAVGYADGYPRTLSNCGNVLIKGHRAPILGRVCMDICMADVTEIPDVKVEDTVTLIGRDGNECITAEELGRTAASFNYETVCRISKRVKRIYLKKNSLL